MINNAYQVGSICLLVIERVRDIYIVALQKHVDGMYAQFPFVPIHKSILADFVGEAMLVGTFTPASIEASAKVWEENGGAYFTITPSEIWGVGIGILSRDHDYQSFYTKMGGTFPGKARYPQLRTDKTNLIVIASKDKAILGCY